MPLLAGKKILITVVLPNRSIAYRIAKACAREGASLAFTYINDDLKDRVAKITAEFGACPLFRCAVASDEDIAALFENLAREWGGLDGMLHSIAFEPRESLSGHFLDAISRQAVASAQE